MISALIVSNLVSICSEVNDKTLCECWEFKVSGFLLMIQVVFRTFWEKISQKIYVLCSPRAAKLSEQHKRSEMIKRQTLKYGKHTVHFTVPTTEISAI